ncbi:Uncharacterized protein Adt_40081 [Abeliophyllum distichum]|uniref:Aspartic peptidase DDI1-type domain-containing protein n=1 Tax=Abeliophyllum distichum TaxID=126358 RepID=A0ABD1Q6X0_9LAMI
MVPSTDEEHVEQTEQTTAMRESSGTPQVKATVPYRVHMIFRSHFLRDALAQMPSYAKFLKDILSNKCKMEEHETVMLTEECSTILQNKLPPKLKDPGSFTIPCTIGDFYFDKAVCDLGASINLMLFSIFRKLGLGEAKVTTVTLQLQIDLLNIQEELLKIF